MTDEEHPRVRESPGVRCVQARGMRFTSPASDACVFDLSNGLICG